MKICNFFGQKVEYRGRWDFFWKDQKILLNQCAFRRSGRFKYDSFNHPCATSEFSAWISLMLIFQKAPDGKDAWFDLLQRFVKPRSPLINFFNLVFVMMIQRTAVQFSKKTSELEQYCLVSLWLIISGWYFNVLF